MTWKNPVDDCPLCEMEKKTKWYEETEDFVIAEKLTGGPFIVLKEHQEEISEDMLEKAHEVTETQFGEHRFIVLMNIVENHWHAHIRE